MRPPSGTERPPTPERPSVTPESPKNPPSPETPPSAQPEQKEQTLQGVSAADILPLSAATSGGLHRHLRRDIDNNKLPKQPEAHHEREGWEYSPVGKIVSGTCFSDEHATGGIQNNFVELFKGRALFALEEPLQRQKKITIQPLWEPQQLNWHVALHAPEE